MKLAAIYTRFSSDLQRDRSIDDQVAVCRDYAERNGYEIAEVYSDRATSGASLHGRPGIKRLMDHAKRGVFQTVIAETMSRIGRDQEDRAAIRKRLQFADVEIVTPTDGVVTHLTDGIRAVIDSQYLEDLKGMIRRGMKGVVRDGRHAGGRAYGYRPVPGKTGHLEIIEAEAKQVRRIFRLYAEGVSPREIASRLNAEGISPPRGRHWAASTINGNVQRGNGILQNEIYAGRLVWNRVRMVRDPDSGKRVSRPNPPDEWMRADAEHLRIIDDDLFEKVQRRKGERSHGHIRRVRKAKHLLSGLLRCGDCGGGMQVKDSHRGRIRIVCSTVKESGQCNNRRTYYLSKIEQAVTSGLKSRLSERDAIARYVKEYNAEQKRLAASAINSHAKLTADLERAQKRLDRAVSGYADGDLPREEGRRLVAETANARDQARAALQCAEKPPRVISLHPEAIARYLRNIDELEETLAKQVEGGEHEPARALRELIERVTIAPTPTRAPVRITVTGRLTALVGGEHYPTMRLNANIGGGSLVAEEGLEPPTRGL